MKNIAGKCLYKEADGIDIEADGMADDYTAQNMKFSILRIWSHLLKKFLMENFIFFAV